VNDVIPKYLQTENYQSKKAIATLSNAMDVGDPSNFVRILEIFHHQFSELKKSLTSYSISDKETEETIADVYKKDSYLLDPHGAVGYLSLQHYMKEHPGKKGIFLETAHPVKFQETVEKITGEIIKVPSSIRNIMGKEKKSLKIRPGYKELKDYLLQ
jgi:threonine synthase